MSLKNVKYLVVLLSIVSCNNLTMENIFKDENLPLKVDGNVTDVEFYRGGNITLVVKEKDGKIKRASVDTLYKEIIKKGDYFIKQANSNKCIIERNDSMIYLDCYNIPKDIRDSIGKIEEWPSNQKGKWKLK